MTTQTAQDKKSAMLDTLIDAISGDTVPWRKPWSRSALDLYAPRSGTSGNAYHGINSFYLSIIQLNRNITDGRWFTFNQIKNLDGCSLRKGSRGEPIVFYKKLTIDADTEDERTIPLLRHSIVFSAEDIDGLEPMAIDGPNVDSIRDENLLASIMENSEANIQWNGGNRAFYVPLTDTIHMPPKTSFPDASSFYGTMMHELGHWTAHESRTPRQAPFDRPAEELTAEITAFLTCMELNMSFSPQEIEHQTSQSAAYLKSWGRTDENKTKLQQALKDAAIASDYLIAFAMRPTEKAE